MQRREQYLLIGLVAAVLLWQGGKLMSSTFLDPLWRQQRDLAALQKSVDEKTRDLSLLERQKESLKDWKRRSLPPDPPSKLKQRPNALNAQRLYQDWLLDLALLSGFEQLKVSPDRLSVSPDNVFVSVSVKIDAEAHFEQLCRFLDRFYRTDLLHRVTSLRIQSREAEGDPFLHFVLEAEGLAIVDAPQKRRLFAQTSLDEELSDDATTLKVKSTEGFPGDPGFLVRLKNEYLEVTGIDGNVWTVARAQDGTTAASFPAGSILEHTPLNTGASLRSAEQIKQMLDSNVFVKPAPPTQYKPKLSPLGEKTLTRGKPIEFNIVVTGYDPSRGRPEFTLLDPLIPGSRIDKGNGKFAWAPASNQKAGKYTFKFEIKHPSAPGGRLSDAVNIALREPNTAPKIVPTSVPPVFIGREWKYRPQVTDAETATDSLTWKLGENPPDGLEIDDTTGELTWTPNDATEAGAMTVNLIATDDGTPPLSATYPLKVNVQDDAAAFTFLTAIFIRDGDPLAVFYDRSQNKSIELKVGTRFTVADVQGVVTKIDKKYLMFSRNDATERMELGQSLREISDEKAKPASVNDGTDAVDRTDGAGRSERSDKTAPADATQPANAPANRSNGRE